MAETPASKPVDDNHDNHAIKLESETCTLSMPTTQGHVPIVISDEMICNEYESTGRSFCALPASFRNSWRHACPSSPSTLSSLPPSILLSDADTVVDDPPASFTDGDPATELHSGTGFTAQPGADMTPFYVGALGAFSAGIIVMCILGVCTERGRRARN
ncbi:hypothetical protein F4776DRAFT_665687 [Hypoxylon sp. NC0597]|nr:hypothetical protein F4776DRAFT_665687 [Hypoxylon sp. NC0597]